MNDFERLRECLTCNGLDKCTVDNADDENGHCVYYKKNTELANKLNEICKERNHELKK